MQTRIVYTKIWKDEWYSGLPRSSKLLFMYLLTNQEIGMTGTYELPDRQIIFDTGLTSAELEQSKQDLQGKVSFHKGWVKIHNTGRYNNYTGETNTKASEKEMKLIPKEVSDTLSIPHTYPIDTPSIGYMEVSATSDTPINHKSEIRNHKREGIVKGRDVEVEKAALALLEKYNSIYGRDLKSTAGFESNLTFWMIQGYSVEDIIGAIENSHKDDFWRPKMTLDVLLRQKTPQGEPVDRIGQFMNHKKNVSLSDPIAQWSEERSQHEL